MRSIPLLALLGVALAVIGYY